jgi:hypothetical protein
MKHLLLAMIILCCSAEYARAEITGNQLYEWCETPRQPSFQGLCLGYIAGTLDMLRTASRELSDPRINIPMYCEPSGVTGEQLTAMARTYLVQHPEQRHFVAASILFTVYTKAFPCR